MIDREARMSAMAVAAGADPSDCPDDKAALYGLLAKSMDAGSLEDMSLSPVRNFKELWFSAGFGLTEVAVTGYHNLGLADRQAAEELFLKRDAGAVTVRRRYEGSVEFGPLRIATACLSAANREILTLRTIARGIDEGIPVTERGVMLSGRVPLGLALLHLYDLNEERENYREEWQSPQGDTGQVFARSVTLIEQDGGLRLLATPEYGDAVARNQHGPQIGCPASMVRGYIQKFHQVVTEAAIESGLIRPS